MPTMRVAKHLWDIALVASAVGLLAAPNHAIAAGDAKRGKVIYAKNCQGCHGPTGAGVGGATPNLADPKRMSPLTDQQLYQAVTQGRPGTGMPAWESVLNEQDRWHVVAYLRTLSAR